MFTIFSLQKRALIPLTMLALLVFLLAGCHAASRGGSSTAGSGSVASPTPVKGYGGANGCPSDMVVGAAPPKANVMLRYSDANTTITAHNGDVIEVRLPFGHKWSGPLVSQGILQIQPPEGYAWKTNNVCVWRFVAQGTGNVSLNFTGQPLCKRGQMCPLYIMMVPFKIDVK
jgi:hypothetical protein